MKPLYPLTAVDPSALDCINLLILLIFIQAKFLQPPCIQTPPPLHLNG